MHPQVILDNIRSSTPKSTRNRYRLPTDPHDRVKRRLVLATAGLGTVILILLIGSIVL
jgi:hypothetical protein